MMVRLSTFIPTKRLNLFTASDSNKYSLICPLLVQVVTTLSTHKSSTFTCTDITDIYSNNCNDRFVLGLGNSTIVIHCRDSRSTIVMMIVLLTIVIVVDMIFE